MMITAAAVSSEDVVAFLEQHRNELLMLYDLMDDDETGAMDRVEISRRIACIDSLLATHVRNGRPH